MLVSEFKTAVLSYMDADGSTRWTPAEIVAVGGIVCQNEWSDIVNQNRFYRFATRSVTTDSSGRVVISDLNSGSGDNAQYFYRVLAGFTDGNSLWRETDFSSVPMATLQNSQSPSDYLFYLAGDYFQLLPVQAGNVLTVAVNHTPPTIAQLAGDSSTIPFPSGYEYILVWVTAGTLLMKGAAESQAASDLMVLADGARKNMLGDIARRTTRPTSALFQDSPSAWGGA